jgi:tRNA U34 5-methylaminomethyl-2-thiouridine-forming methyltransferase MnmC
MNDQDKYELIITGDGSYSLFSGNDKEAMHTIDGAYLEAKFKYVEMSKICEIEKQVINILDIGFGLGYNILALLDERHKSGINKFYNIVSLENDKGIEKWLDAITFNDKRDSDYNKIKSAFRNGKYHDNDCSITVIIDDARNAIIDLIKNESMFDVVFQDAYSPSKNPELWSLDYFVQLKKIMYNGAILTTYSAAPQVRMAMIKAGFHVGSGPSIGRKKEGTVASTGKKITGLSKERIDDLMADIKSTVYRDESLTGSRKDILKQRIDEMSDIRRNRQARQE